MILKILSLVELADAQIVRLRVPTTNGNYEEVGTRLDTLARFIRGVADGEKWRTEIGFAADGQKPKRRMTIDEDGFPDFN